MAVAATAAVMTPAILGVTPATASEQPGTTPATVPDRDVAEDAKPLSVEVEPGAEAEASAERRPSAGTPAATPLPSAPAWSPVKRNNAPLPAKAPVLGLKGVPESFEAGGDWGEFSATVDHSEGREEESYELVLVVASKGWVARQDIQLQVLLQGAWHDVPFMPIDGDSIAPLVRGMTIPTGKLTIPVRVRFSAQAPLTEINIILGGSSAIHEEVKSDSFTTPSRIVAPHQGGEELGGVGEGGEEPGRRGEGDLPAEDGDVPAGDACAEQGGGGTSNVPGPENSAVLEASDAHTAAATGNTGNADGQLAKTGADVNSWLLGIGGLVLTAGAGLVVGTGKRRRSKRGA